MKPGPPKCIFNVKNPLKLTYEHLLILKNFPELLPPDPRLGKGNEKGGGAFSRQGDMRPWSDRFKLRITNRKLLPQLTLLNFYARCLIRWIFWQTLYDCPLSASNAAIHMTLVELYIWSKALEFIRCWKRTRLIIMQTMLKANIRYRTSETGLAVSSFHSRFLDNGSTDL